MLVPTRMSSLEPREGRSVRRIVTERAHLMKVGISDPTQALNIHEKQQKNCRFVSLISLRRQPRCSAGIAKGNPGARRTKGAERDVRARPSATKGGKVLGGFAMAGSPRKEPGRSLPCKKSSSSPRESGRRRGRRPREPRGNAGAAPLARSQRRCLRTASSTGES